MEPAARGMRGDAEVGDDFGFYFGLCFGFGLGLGGWFLFGFFRNVSGGFDGFGGWVEWDGGVGDGCTGTRSGELGCDFDEAAV